MSYTALLILEKSAPKKILEVIKLSGTKAYKHKKEQCSLEILKYGRLKQPEQNVVTLKFRYRSTDLK